MRISSMIGRIGFALSLAVSVPLGLASSTFITIVPTFDSTITSDPNAAAIEGVINTAINNYETRLTTPSPLTVTILFQSMTTGLGQSNTSLYQESYPSFIAALDANSSGDATDLAAVAANPSAATNPVNGTSTIDVKTANLRALGMCTTLTCPSGEPGGYDGIIGLNTHITDVGSPGTSGQYSLLGTAEHEIDEVLGFGIRSWRDWILREPCSGGPLPLCRQRRAELYHQHRGAQLLLA